MSEQAKSTFDLPRDFASLAMSKIKLAAMTELAGGLQNLTAKDIEPYLHAIQGDVETLNHEAKQLAEQMRSDGADQLNTATQQIENSLQQIETDFNFEIKAIDALNVPQATLTDAAKETVDIGALEEAQEEKATRDDFISSPSA